MTMRGIPYTIGEAKLAAESRGMDPYSRELMQFLIEQIAVERETCAKIAESYAPAKNSVSRIEYDGVCECIAEEIRARATTPPRTP